MRLWFFNWITLIFILFFNFEHCVLFSMNCTWSGLIGPRLLISLWKIWKSLLLLMKTCSGKLLSSSHWKILGRSSSRQVIWWYCCCIEVGDWEKSFGLFRENEQLSGYRDTKTARTIMLVELKKLIEANPLFREKLQFPSIKTSRLRMLINQRYK